MRLSRRQPLALLLAASLASAAAADGQDRLQIAAEPCLNLRLEPRVDAGRKSCLPTGTKVLVTGSAPGWRQVELENGTTGWLAAEYLAPSSPVAHALAVSTEVPRLGALEPVAVEEPFVRLEPFAASPLPAAASLEVTRGVFRQRRLLTGELVARRSTPVIVPRTEAWSVAIRWLVDDGKAVKPGDPLVEFDNSNLVSELEDLRISAVEAAEQLERARVEGAALGAEKHLARERARIELEKAKLRAAVPATLLSRREHKDRELAHDRAQVEFDKAEEDYQAHIDTTRAEVDIQKIALNKAERRIAKLERDLEALRIVAQESGIALIERHPWESRKYSVGDTVWPGMRLVTLPDLTSLWVEAELSDVDDGKIDQGAAALCRLDAYPDVAHACRVSSITPVAQAPSPDSLRRSFKVELDLERTAGQDLRPGMSVGIEIESRRLKDALLVPRSALELATTPAQVLLARGGSREVELGPCNAQVCVATETEIEGLRLRPRAGKR